MTVQSTGLQARRGNRRNAIAGGNSKDEDAAGGAKRATNKAISSPRGWAFLTNDPNDFLSVFAGQDRWTQADAAKASQVITDRSATLAAMGIPYRKYIVPEKPVIYAEYLPQRIRSQPRASERPATLLSAGNAGVVHYLDKYLLGMKSLGLLYFRCDTHTNWLGAWLTYRFIMQTIMSDGIMPTSKLLSVSDLHASVEPFEGDLMPLLSEESRILMKRRFGHTMPTEGIELATRLEIPQGDLKARRVETPQEYRDWYVSRDTFTFEREDRLGPKAVFFRDSTLGRGAMALLAQHFHVRCSCGTGGW